MRNDKESAEDEAKIRSLERLLSQTGQDLNYPRHDLNKQVKAHIDEEYERRRPPPSRRWRPWRVTIAASLIFVVGLAGIIALRPWLADRPHNRNHEVTTGNTSSEFLIGSTQNYAGRPETIPDGYLACDGREIKRKLYPILFDRLGTMYGPGDGETTFNLPDYRGEFLRGADNMGTGRKSRGIDGGRTVASRQTDGFQQHSHGQNLTVNTQHRHRVVDVYHIGGNVGALEYAGSGKAYSAHSLIAGYPYGYLRTPETPVPPEGVTPDGEYAGPRQSPPFQGGHEITSTGSDPSRQDDRWSITTRDGNPKQSLDGSIGGANQGSYQSETRPRNVATLIIIRAK